MIHENRAEELRQMAWRVRRSAVEMAHQAGRHGAHLGGSLSSVEIYTVLYGAVLNFQLDNPLWQERDRMVAGKEHGRLSEYSAMVEAGILQPKDLLTYQADDGLLAGHPLNPSKGLEYSCCSLGMALPVAVGMALDAKRSGRKHRVFTLLGDGEMDEGLVWEGVLAAAQFKLDNLIAIIDRNRLSSDGDTETVMALGDLQMKMNAFGWECVSVDGHDVEELLRALEAQRPEDKPYAIIANTVKGKGLSFAENNYAWHWNVLTDELYDIAVHELEEERI